MAEPPNAHQSGLRPNVYRAAADLLLYRSLFSCFFVGSRSSCGSTSVCRSGVEYKVVAFCLGGMLWWVTGRPASIESVIY